MIFCPMQIQKKKYTKRKTWRTVSPNDFLLGKQNRIKKGAVEAEIELKIQSWSIYCPFLVTLPFFGVDWIENNSGKLQSSMCQNFAHCQNFTHFCSPPSLTLSISIT